MASNLQLDFGNLPLVETVVRASFEEPLELTFSRIDRIREILKQSFPHVTEPKQHEAAPGIKEEIEFGPGKLTGVVFDGHAKGLQATLQSRVAVVRWRRQSVIRTPEYPRFPHLKAAFWDVVGAVKTAYGLDSIPLVVVNLSYANFIPVDDFSGVLPHYFSPKMQLEAVRHAEEVRKLEVAWLEDGIDLRFNLQQTSATFGEETKVGCLLTTVAAIRVKKARGGDEAIALDEVHSRLQVLFRDIISEDAKREWKLTQVPT